MAKSATGRVFWIITAIGGLIAVYAAAPSDDGGMPVVSASSLTHSSDTVALQEELTLLKAELAALRQAKCPP
ncbi:MAG TPA: hypothetical protein VNO33_11880 [Kofleriaceae bacterium]|nr:hypothetical protein [Kofleriaceae bacterium]